MFDISEVRDNVLAFNRKESGDAASKHTRLFNLNLVIHSIRKKSYKMIIFMSRHSHLQREAHHYQGHDT